MPPVRRPNRVRDRARAECKLIKEHSAEMERIRAIDRRNRTRCKCIVASVFRWGAEEREDGFRAVLVRCQGCIRKDNPQKWIPRKRFYKYDTELGPDHLCPETCKLL